MTGLSKKTCVVRFLDYGNFEEVLQDDCLPVTEVRLDLYQLILKFDFELKLNSFSTDLRE